MTHSDTLTSETRPTTSVDGLEVEVLTTEEEAQAAFAAVPSHVEQQAAAFVAATEQIASELEG
jgi:exopolyphosphatase/pppGpp-phosphohydrolase